MPNTKLKPKSPFAPRLLDAAVELLALAKRRGDDDLPHPSNDPKFWTARMQDAWTDLESAIISEHGEAMLDAKLHELIQAEREVAKTLGTPNAPDQRPERENL